MEFKYTQSYTKKAQDFSSNLPIFLIQICNREVKKMLSKIKNGERSSNINIDGVYAVTRNNEILDRFIMKIVRVLEYQTDRS